MGEGGLGGWGRGVGWGREVGRVGEGGWVGEGCRVGEGGWEEETSGEMLTHITLAVMARNALPHSWTVSHGRESSVRTTHRCSGRDGRGCLSDGTTGRSAPSWRSG